MKREVSEVENISIRTRASTVRKSVADHLGWDGVKKYAPNDRDLNGPLTEKKADNISEAIDRSLVQIARNAKEDAFAPHSEYPVGASLFTDKGIYTGANVEVSAIQPIHAEQLAISKAVTDGAEEFYVMAISPGPDPSGEVAPCGLCQHTMSQFTEELRILEDAGNGDSSEYWLSELIGPGYSADNRHFDKAKDKE